MKIPDGRIADCPVSAWLRSQPVSNPGEHLTRLRNMSTSFANSIKDREIYRWLLVKMKEYFDNGDRKTINDPSWGRM